MADEMERGEARAREVLATEFEQHGVTGYARHIVSGRCDWVWVPPALSAMLAYAAEREAAATERAARIAETFRNNHPHGPAITADRLRRDIAATIRESAAARKASAKLDEVKP